MSELKSTGYLEMFFMSIGYLKVYEVSGYSMYPTFAPGERLLIDPMGTIAEGDVVVIRHPHRTDVEMLKRVERIEDDGSFYVLGDNPSESTDSREFGAIIKRHLKGKAVASL